MAGLIARVQLISNALILLGDRPIASISENTTGALLGANLFENTYLSMLQNHRWRFSIKAQSLSKLSAKPNTGYNTAFQLPDDMLYIVKADTRDYTIYGNELHCNQEAILLDYATRVEEDILPHTLVGF